MDTPDKRTRDALQQINWTEMLERLLFYARAKHSGTLKRIGLDPMEVVSRAVESVWSGNRKWRHDVDPFVQLCGVLRSSVSNLNEGWKREVCRTTSLDYDSNIIERIGQRDAHDPERDIHKPGPGALDLAEILDFLEDDELAVAVVKFRISVPDCTAAELAAKLDLETKDIYNANRRIKARLRSLRPGTIEPRHDVSESTEDVVSNNSPNPDLS